MSFYGTKGRFEFQSHEWLKTHFRSYHLVRNSKHYIIYNFKLCNDIILNIIINTY